MYTGSMHDLRCMGHPNFIKHCGQQPRSPPARAGRSLAQLAVGWLDPRQPERREQRPLVRHHHRRALGLGRALERAQRVLVQREACEAATSQAPSAGKTSVWGKIPPSHC